jgi:DNA-binding transcriptional MerR regulator/methylmalonyl-CoA mutase cobalamin-binding subunit
MATIDRTPTFNLKAVIQETGLKPDTLRAWERRYGLPNPKRTAGRHRLYSQYDIEILKWLVARQEEGLSISRAVALWRQLEADGKNPLEEPAYALPEKPAGPPSVPTGSTLVELKQEWYDACLAFDEKSADNVLTYALALFPPETVCIEILMKNLAAIGEAWYRGAATVQQEHFASESAMRRLEAMVAALPPPTRPGRIMVGCAPKDDHSFPALLLTFLLRLRGYAVTYLGARVPSSEMSRTAAAINPNLVIMTAQHLYTAAALLETARYLQTSQVPLAFGGRIFNLVPSLRKRVPGFFLGERIEDAPAVVDQLLTTHPHLPPVEDLGGEYRGALAHFRERQMLIEASTWQRMAGTNIQAEHLANANQAFERSIAAALALGDIALLCTDIDWVAGLIENNEIPREVLSRYLDAYYVAAQTHLDDRGKIVVDYLAQLNGNLTSERQEERAQDAQGENRRASA